MAYHGCCLKIKITYVILRHAQVSFFWKGWTLLSFPNVIFDNQILKNSSPLFSLDFEISHLQIVNPREFGQWQSSILKILRLNPHPYLIPISLMYKYWY